MRINLPGRIEKGWGYEEIVVSTLSYCVKYLVFTEPGACFSMHFHRNKEETWIVEEGEFQVTMIDTSNAQVTTRTLLPGDVWNIFPLQPHRLTCVEEGRLLEVSTADDPKDNYRVLPGDSQSG